MRKISDFFFDNGIFYIKRKKKTLHSVIDNFIITLSILNLTLPMKIFQDWYAVSFFSCLV